jgi:hypothetical protein
MNITNDNLSITSVSATTYYNLPTEELVVYVVNNISLPQQTIYKPQVSMLQAIKRVEYINNYITPPPRIINISNNNIYLRICGEITSDSKNVGCRNCVDEWLDNNQDKRGPMDLTRNNTRCK